MASRHFAIAVVALPILGGIFTYFSTSSISLEPLNPAVQYCFEESSISIRVTTQASCPAPLIPLGSGRLSESATVVGSVDVLHPLLLNRFNAAKIAAHSDGVNLYITSGFRSRERQGQLFSDAIVKYGSESEAAKWVLPPQFSHHPEGLALDVNYPGDRAGAKWLERNGSIFGLCRVYANEWWHFEGVSAPGEPCPAMAPNALTDLG